METFAPFIFFAFIFQSPNIFSTVKFVTSFTSFCKNKNKIKTDEYSFNS